MGSLTGTTPIHSQYFLLSPFRSTTKPLLLSIPFTSNFRVFRVSRVKASSTSNPNPITRTIRTATSAAIILTATSAALLSPLRARADQSPPPSTEEKVETETNSLELSSESIDAIRSLVYQKLEEGEDSEALSLLNRLISSQPAETEWKFLAARLLNEMGEAIESRRLYEEILAVDPLSFEALFENAVLMDRCGEGDAVIERLKRALEIARSEQKEKSARDVCLIMAQIKFLQKNVDEALESYEELAREDPKDYRPYFCQGVIYSLLGQNKEAREKFAKYKELSPKKFEVDAFLQTPLSRVKLFGIEDSEI